MQQLGVGSRCCASATRAVQRLTLRQQNNLQCELPYALALPSGYPALSLSVHTVITEQNELWLARFFGGIVGNFLKGKRPRGELNATAVIVNWVT